MRYRLVAFLCAVTCISTAFGQQSEAPSTAKGKAANSEATTQTSSPKKSRPGFLDEKYANGKPKSQYAVNAKGVKWGPYSLYSEDGKRIERGAFRNGELEGARQTFYPNGKVNLEENYSHGQLNGSVLESDDTGNAVRAAQYKAGSPVSDRTLVDGIMVYPRSPQMIVAELDRIQKTKVETVQAKEVIPPHEGGNDSQADREDALRRLMQYRYLCCVPYEDMKLDPVYCAHDEAAAGILAAIGKLDHTPLNPGWADDRYRYAYTGTSNSNIYQDPRGGPICATGVDAWMDDSDASNIDRVGHRRWCLNPPMAKVGFAGLNGFAAMWSMDTSRNVVPDFDFVAYPSPGFFPSTYLGADAAWSVSLSEARYRKPPLSGLTVTITPAQVQLAQNKILPAGKPLELNYHAVNNDPFGIANCIIFRPTGLETEPGSAYLVEVTGLQAINGKAAAIRFIVEFFNPEPGKAASPAPQ